jgi:hypothetical protein
MVNITILTVTGTASLIKVLSIGPAVRSMPAPLGLGEIFKFDFGNLSRLFPEKKIYSTASEWQYPKYERILSLNCEKEQDSGGTHL